MTTHGVASFCVRHLVGIYMVAAATVVIGFACQDALRFIVPALVGAGVILILVVKERGRGGPYG